MEGGQARSHAGKWSDEWTSRHAVGQTPGQARKQADKRVAEAAGAQMVETKSLNVPKTDLGTVSIEPCMKNNMYSNKRQLLKYRLLTENSHTELAGSNLQLPLFKE